MKKLFLSLALLSLPYSLFAEHEKSIFDDFFEYTNDYRQFIHESSSNFSSSLDNYDRHTHINIEDYNSSYIFFEASSYFNDSSRLSFDQKLKVKLTLPNIKKDIKLIFENEEKDYSNQFNEDIQTNKADTYNLALVYNELIDTIDFKTKIGFKINRLDPFIKIEAKKKFENIYGLDYTISQSIKKSLDKDFESITYFLIDKTFNEHYSLHNYNDYYWDSKNENYDRYYNSIYLNQKLSDHNYLTYQINTNINDTESNLKIKRYSASIRIRHYIKSWIYTDLIPENYYRDENNFKSEYSIRFNLGIYFNDKSYKNYSKTQIDY